MKNTPQQLSLGISLSDDADFDNFFHLPGTHNAMVIQGLRDQISGAGEGFIYLWGAPGCGLTHLLQASCLTAQAQHVRAQYLPLHDLAGYAPTELFAELEHLDMICLDNLDAVAGRMDWELALFHLYNSLHDQGKKLLVAARANPREIALNLPDLRSRLQWGITYHVYTMTDTEKQQALQKRARVRGLELSDEVAQYIVQRLPRDTNELFWQLQRLDSASLAEQRKLTIPFVKKVLAI
jgi:DnaA family protein